MNLEKTQDPFNGSAITSILVVSDLEKSKNFYIEKLGASLFREYWGNSVVLNFLDHWILLVLPGGPTEDKPSIHFSRHPDQDVVDHSFTIRVADCRLSHDILESRGVWFITPPHKRGKEVRCFFKDPDGHLFEISEYR